MKNKIILLLDKKIEIYRNLFIVASQLKNGIINAHPDVIHRILRQTAELIAQIKNIDQKLNPYVAAWDEEYPVQKGLDQGEIKSRLQEIGGLIRNILGMNEACEKIALEKTGQLKANLDALQRGIQATRAYIPVRIAKPRFIDSRG